MDALKVAWVWITWGGLAVMAMGSLWIIFTETLLSLP